MSKKQTKKAEEPSAKEEVEAGQEKDSPEEGAPKAEVSVKKEEKKAEEQPSVKAKEKKEGKEAEEKKPAEKVPEKVAASPKVLKVLELVKAMSPEERSEFGVSMIKELSVLELSEWVKTLEKEFGVSAQAAVAVAAAAPDGAAAPAEEKKDSYSVMLVSIGDKKIQVIKEVRTITSLGLREAKALVDEAPKPVKEGVTEKEANEIKAKLESAGATVELK